MRNYLVAFTVVFLILFNASTIFAQEDTSLGVFKTYNEFGDLSPKTGDFSCFDQYRLGSVDVNIRSDIQSAIPGVPMTFTAIITNENNYPVVDGSLYLKVFRVQENIFQDHLIDQFHVLDDIVLDANESKSFIFEWTPYRELPSGEYYIAPYFTSVDKYNLQGLSFTDDISGTKYRFDIIGEEDPLYFDTSTVSINEEPYQFIDEGHIVGEKEQVDIEVSIVNESSVEKTVSIEWNIYQWDALSEDNLIGSTSETVSIPANGSKSISYSLTANDYPVYVVVPKLIQRDTISSININIGREDINIPRLSFSSVVNYPIVGGEKNIIFACLYNMGDLESISDSSLSLEVIDSNGKKIHSYNYDGDISNDMLGVKDTFTLNRSISNFSLVATLTQNGVVVDETTLTYSCDDINSDKCTTSGDIDFISTLIMILKENILFLGIALLLIFGVLFYLFRRPDEIIGNNNIEDVN